MRTTKISTFDQSHLVKAIKVMNANPRTYKLGFLPDCSKGVTNIYRNVGEHYRHNIYDNRTGKCIASTHSFPHGAVRYRDKEIWVTDLTTGERYELRVDSRVDFFKRMREILTNIQ